MILSYYTIIQLVAPHHILLEPLQNSINKLQSKPDIITASDLTLVLPPIKLCNKAVL